MDKLPEEILLRIFTNRGTCYYGNTLRKLLLVSRKFYRIAKPLLYSECNLVRPTRSIRRMLNTLVTCYDARPLVRSLEVGIYEPYDAKDVSDAAISITELSDIVQSVETLASYPLDYQRRLGIDLLNSSRDATIATILKLLPNLDSFTLKTSPSGRRGLVAEGDNRLDFSSPDLPNTLVLKLIELSTTPSLAAFSLFGHLRYAFIDCFRYDNDDFSGWDSSVISFFLRLPALETFEGIGCREADGNNPWACEESASVVTTIDLHQCQIGAETIGSILRSCRALKYFACSRVCYGCLHDETICDYSYANIHDDLFCHQESLHTLRLDNQACRHYNSGLEDPVTTLAALDNLENLEVDEFVLFEQRDDTTRCLTEILPAGLHHLGIYCENEGSKVFRAIWRLLHSHKTLTSVTFNHTYLPDAEKMLEELSGIAIAVIGNRYPHGYATFRMYRAESKQNEVASGTED